MKFLLRCMEWFAFSLGVGLLLANIAGLFTSLRNPAIYSEPKVNFKNDITLTVQQVYAAAAQPVIDRKAYLTQLTAAVNQGIAHYWRMEGIDTYHLRVPFQENYLLFVASYLDPQTFRMYEFCNYRHAIERGVGLCSQHAIILVELLQLKGIPAQVVGLGGHVVVQAEADAAAGEWWILDADYGVIIPDSIQTVQDDPTFVIAYYLQAGYSSKTAAEMKKYYTAEGNQLFPLGSGVRGFYPRRCLLEQLADVLIWVIPLILGIPWLSRRIIRHLPG
jgi:hypothetical protein